MSASRDDAELTAELERTRAIVERLFEVLGALVIVLERDGRVFRFNRACQDLTGWTERELVGIPFWDVLLLPEERAGVQQVFGTLAAGMFPMAYENHWVTRDGDRRFIRWNSTCLTNEAGDVTYVIGTGVDVTDERATRQALIDSEERYRNLIEYAPEAIVVINGASRTIVTANRRASEIFGVPAAALEGLDVSSWEPAPQPDGRPSVATLFDALDRARAGATLTVQWTALHAVTHEPLPFEVTLAPVHGAATQVRATLVDLRSRRQAEADARLRKITAQIDGAVFEARRSPTEPTATIGYVSDRFGELLGVEMDAGSFAVDQLVGLAHPDDRLALLDAFEDVLSESRGQAIAEFRRVLPNGATRWLLVKAGLTFEPDGSHVWTGFLADVSARRAAEARVAAAEQRFRMIFDRLPVPVTTSDATGRRVYCNRAYMDVLGYGMEEVPTIRDAIMRYIPDPTERDQIMARALAHLRDRERASELLVMPSVRIVNKAGQQLTMDLHMFQTDETGIAVFVDVTEREAAFTALAAANQGLTAANEELEAFSYSVSHDLRAPLRHIDGFSAALAEDFMHELPQAAATHLTAIRGATRRMGQLIDDLLRLSQVSRAELRHERVDLSALARDIARELQERAPERQVRWDIDDGIVVEGDAPLLRIAIANLFDNSYKYTARRPVANVSFRAHPEGTRVVCRVSDDGAGFDMRYSAKLFGAFQRMHTDGDYSGTGIGLATVKRIVMRHGGTITAAAEPNRGASFTFDLPRPMEGAA